VPRISGTVIDSEIARYIESVVYRICVSANLASDYESRDTSNSEKLLSSESQSAVENRVIIREPRFVKIRSTGEAVAGDFCYSDKFPPFPVR